MEVVATGAGKMQPLRPIGLSSSDDNSLVAQDGLQFTSNIKKKVAKGGNANLELVQAHLRSIDSELIKTKQSIVRHVLESRKLEKSRSLVLQSQYMLQEQLFQKLQPAIYNNKVKLQQALAQDYKISLNNDILVTIDQKIGWNYPGIVPFICSVITSYSDKELVSYLKSIPAHLLPMKREMFIKIVDNSSKSMISEHEAVNMFDSVVHKKTSVNEHRGATTTNDQSQEDYLEQWESMQRLLCRKLALQFVLSKVMPFIHDQEEKLRSNRTFRYDLSLMPTTAVPSIISQSFGNLTDTSSVVSEASKASKSSTIYKKSRAKKLLQLSSTTPTTTNRSHSTSSKNLKEDLMKSLSAQDSLKSKLVENMSRFLLEQAQNTHDSSTSSLALKSAAPNSYNAVAANNPAIKQYFQRQACGKLHATLFKIVVSRLMAHSFDKWKTIALKISKIECKVLEAIRSIGAARLFRVVEWKITRNMAQMFDTWRVMVEHYENNSRHAGSIDIQRVFRGHLARKRIKELKHVRSQALIKTAASIAIAHKLGRRWRQHLHKKKMVRRLERVWRFYQGKLGMLHKRQEKIYRKNAMTIQRVYRGYLGRRKYKQKTLKLVKNKSAIKVQSCYRRFKAIVFVDERRLARKQLFAAIKLQSQIRRLLQRIKYSDLLTRHKNVVIITYAWWCSRAREELTRRKRHHAAIQIQRIVRGKIARNLRETLRIRREIQRAKQKAALAVITPVAMGFAVRYIRRFKDKIKENSRQRNFYAQRLQTAWRALYFGYCARQRVKILRQEKAQRDILLKDIALKNFAATQIQKVIRRKINNWTIQQWQARRVIELEEQRMKVPVYYRLKERYYSTQNSIHFRSVVMLQCQVRRYLAVKKVSAMRKTANRQRIGEFICDQVRRRRGKRIRAAIIAQRVDEALKIVAVQKIFRGFIVRKRRKVQEALRCIQYVIKEKKVREKIRMHENFAVEKEIKATKTLKATKLQAFVRTRIAKKNYKKNYRVMVSGCVS